MEYQWQTDLYDSRDTIRNAFQLNLIDDGENWMDMLASRNRTSHTYNRETAEEIRRAIKKVYLSLFRQLEKKLTRLAIDTD